MGERSNVSRVRSAFPSEEFFAGECARGRIHERRWQQRQHDH
jgi:hypothetical protein